MFYWNKISIKGGLNLQEKKKKKDGIHEGNGSLGRKWQKGRIYRGLYLFLASQVAQW